METFFKPNRVYAVAGASTDPKKFGNKVLQWYIDRNLPVTPINYRAEPVLGLDSVKTLAEVQIPKGSDLALSIVTPPGVTSELLNSIGSMPVHSVWLQPGTWTPDIVERARQSVPSVITDCILVKGDRYLSHKL